MSSTTKALVELVCTMISLPGNTVTYVVRKGDTLGEVLYRNVPGRIYGPGNNLEKVKRLNPKLQSVHMLDPGITLELPKGDGEYTQLELSSQSKNMRQAIGENGVVKTPLVKKVTKSDEVSLHQSIIFGIKLSSESLKALEKLSNASEISNSDLGYGYFLRWEHKWNEDVHYFLEGSMRKFKFKVASNKTLSGDTILKMDAFTGIKWNFQESHLFEGSMGLVENLILNSDSGSILNIDKVVTPVLKIAGKHTVIRFKRPYTVYAFWNAGGIFPTKQSAYETEWGSFWEVGSESTYELEGRSFTISVSYGQDSLTTDSLEQTNKSIEIGASIGVEF